MNNTGVIILAAGSSSRFGNPKQLLPFNGKTLLNRTIDEAAEAGAQPIVVVTGARADEISREISSKDVDIVFNKHWEQGMASGIAVGLKKALTIDKALRQVIIAVCDQPYISSSLFQQLVQKQEQTARHIVASAYADTIGTPALFTERYFDALIGLTGDHGAKKLFRQFSNDLTSVEFPDGSIDIDTREDYENLLKAKGGP